MSYLIAMPIVVGLAGAVTQYLLTGKRPGEQDDGSAGSPEEATRDLYFPRTGELDSRGRPARVVLPSYMKDLYHYWHDPGQTLRNKIHPQLSLIAEMLANEDFYNTEIRNPDDPLVSQLRDLALHVGKGFEPFASRGARRNIEEGEPPAKVALPFVGITAAPASVGKSEAEALLDAYRASQMPQGARSKESYETARMKKFLRRDVSQGNMQSLRSTIRSGELTLRQGLDVATTAKQGYLVAGFETVPLPEALNIWQAATSDEKKLLKMAMAKKIVNYIQSKPADDIQPLLALIKQTGQEIRGIR